MKKTIKTQARPAAKFVSAEPEPVVAPVAQSESEPEPESVEPAVKDEPAIPAGYIWDNSSGCLKKMAA